MPIQIERTLHEDINNLVYKVDLDSLSDSKLQKHVQKVHKNLCHKSSQQMSTLFEMAGKLDKRTKAVISEVVDKCKICLKFKKTPPRPKVALLKATTNNEVISVDLKEKRNLNKYILYCCDEFSGYIAAAVIPNKYPETIVKACHRRWIREGPGIPSKGIFSDIIAKFCY